MLLNWDRKILRSACTEPFQRQWSVQSWGLPKVLLQRKPKEIKGILENQVWKIPPSCGKKISKKPPKSLPVGHSSPGSPGLSQEAGADFALEQFPHLLPVTFTNRGSLGIHSCPGWAGLVPTPQPGQCHSFPSCIPGAEFHLGMQWEIGLRAQIQSLAYKICGFKPFWGWNSSTQEPQSYLSENQQDNQFFSH